MNNTLMERLIKDYREIMVLQENLGKAIDFKAHLSNQTRLDKYEIEIKIRSLKKSGGKPQEIDMLVHFSIKLPATYPNKPPKCLLHKKDSNKLFHPHLKATLMLNGLIWLNPFYDPQKGLASYVLNLIKSLQYNPEFIDEQAKECNKKAMEWYIQEKKSNPSLFPIDKTPLTTIKTFNIKDQSQNNKKVNIVKTGQLSNTSSVLLQGSQKKFVIKEITPPYQPEEKSIPSFSESSIFPCSCEHTISSPNMLFLTEHAMQEIASFTGWGQTTNFNCVEQGGILLGNVYKEPINNRIYGIVNDVVTAATATGTAAYLMMGHDTWGEMLNQVDNILSLKNKKNIHIIGWFHTHPNELGIFMSETDRGTQARVFCHDWHFAVVLNPLKQSWGVFNGHNAEPCKGCVIRDHTEKGDDNGIDNKITINSDLNKDRLCY